MKPSPMKNVKGSGYVYPTEKIIKETQDSGVKLHERDSH